MKKRSPKNRPVQKTKPQTTPEPVIESLTLGKVKRVAFYISDTDEPKGRQRKVIALGIYYLDALRHLGVEDEDISRWLSKAVDKHCAIYGFSDSWIRIVEYLILKALMAKIEPIVREK